MEKPTRAATGRDSDKYIVRFPEGMRDKIAALAKENNRSMNAEIVARLIHSISESELQPAPILSSADIQDLKIVVEEFKRLADESMAKRKSPKSPNHK